MKRRKFIQGVGAVLASLPFAGKMPPAQEPEAAQELEVAQKMAQEIAQEIAEITHRKPALIDNPGISITTHELLSPSTAVGTAGSYIKITVDGVTKYIPMFNA